MGKYLGSKGIDCSGFYFRVMGITKRNWTTSFPGAPLGGVKKVEIPHISHPGFVKGLKPGDILLWRTHHISIFWGNKKMIDANGKEGKVNSGITTDLESSWLGTNGHPEVYRKN
ncbi:MAG: hypothetical protein JWP37_4368 [Mucilaginibacter sp.]|nr:hypothetical protein [Mucilaginibacter sp.]